MRLIFWIALGSEDNSNFALCALEFHKLFSQHESRNMFRNYHLLVFCCSHVFANERPVLVVCRDGGDWQFLCGIDDHSKTDEPAVVGVGHLTDRDQSLNEIAMLAADMEAERKAINDEWKINRIQPEN